MIINIVDVDKSFLNILLGVHKKDPKLIDELIINIVKFYNIGVMMTIKKKILFYYLYNMFYLSNTEVTYNYIKTLQKLNYENHIDENNKSLEDEFDDNLNTMGSNLVDKFNSNLLEPNIKYVFSKVSFNKSDYIDMLNNLVDYKTTFSSYNIIIDIIGFNLYSLSLAEREENIFEKALLPFKKFGFGEPLLIPFTRLFSFVISSILPNADLKPAWSKKLFKLFTA